MSFLTAREAGLCKLSEAISAGVNLTHLLNSWVEYSDGEGGWLIDYLTEGLERWKGEQETGRPEDETLCRISVLVLHGIVDRATYMIKFSSNFELWTLEFSFALRGKPFNSSVISQSTM